MNTLSSSWLLKNPGLDALGGAVGRYLDTIVDLVDPKDGYSGDWLDKLD